MTGERQDWVTTVKWVDGAWSWVFWRVEPNRMPGGKPYLCEETRGVAWTKLGVMWAAWRECRTRGWKFWPNVRGIVPAASRPNASRKMSR